MVKDDSACATFAIITNKCIRFTGSTTPPSPKLASGVFSTILSTAICITTPEPLVSYERHFYTSQNSLQGDELRPEWALNSTTFKQWKVKLSEDPPSSLESSRRQPWNQHATRLARTGSFGKNRELPIRKTAAGSKAMLEWKCHHTATQYPRKPAEQPHQLQVRRFLTSMVA